MDRSDKILEFLDGTLDGSTEQALFEEMAANSELRAELRDYHSIGTGVQADRAAFAPPAETERGLFAGLGLAAPIGAASGGAAAWLASNSLASMLGGLILGLLLGGGSVWMLTGDLPETPVVAERRIEAPADVSSKPDQLQSDGEMSATTRVEVPGVSGMGVDSKMRGAETERPNLLADSRATSSERNRTSSDGSAVRSVHDGDGGTSMDQGLNDVDRQQSSLPEVNSDLMSPPIISTSTRSEAPPTAVDVTTIKKYGGDGARRSMVSALDVVERSERIDEEPSVRAPAPAVETESERVRQVALEISKPVAAYPFNENGAQPVESGSFLTEDISGAFFYAPGGAWSFGLEAGRDRYTQSLFYNRGDTALLHQMPNVTWGGVSLRRHFAFAGLTTFLQGTLGASQYGGPMVRGKAGVDLLSLLPFDAGSVSMPATIGFSSMVYQYNELYMITGRWGSSIGLQYDFNLD